MAKATATKLRIKSSSFELEFEGSETFLRSEVPKFIKAANELKASAISVSAGVLQTQLEQSHTTKADLDKVIAEIKSDVDSMSEMGEVESLRLQMAMDRLSKMMSTLSNILKKLSDTAGEITQNLK